MYSTLRIRTFQHHAGRGILILSALCLLLLVAARIQPASADDTPTLQFSTYLGGSAQENAADIQVDAQGYIYVVGNTHSDNFPVTANAAQDTRAGDSDIYIVKLNPAGTQIIYSTYLGGSNYEKAYAIAVDAEGSAYVTGRTLSANFPTVSAVQSTYGGAEDGFVTKLSPDGSQFVYSTYLGGNGSDTGLSIGVDSAKHARIVGYTTSSNLPTEQAYQATMNGGSDILLASLNVSGSGFDYLSYLGGNKGEAAMDMLVDASGNSYLAGWTSSSDFPVIAPLQAAYSTPGCSAPATRLCNDGFVVRLNSSGTPTYATYLGGSGLDEVYGIALDTNANIYLAGQTSSSDFPKQNAYQSTVQSVGSAFVSKLNAAGSSLVYSTYLGGANGFNAAMDIAVNPQGKAVVSGYTYATNFPILNAIQATKGGNTTSTNDAFVTVFSPDGTALEFSTYLGGTEDEYNEFNPRLTLNPSDNSLYIAGTTLSADFPVYHALQDTPGGAGTPPIFPNNDGFLAKIALGTIPPEETPVPTPETTEPPPTAVPTNSAPGADTGRNYFTTDRPTLTWTQITWATHYHVQVSQDKLFKGTLAFDDATGANQFSIMTDHLDDGVYYWHVQAQKADNSWGGYSPIESFVIDAD